MDERRKSRGGGVVIFLASALLLLVVLYVVGYFWLPFTMPIVQKHEHGKALTYANPLIVRLYYPAAFVEAKLTHQRILLSSPGEQLLSIGP